MAEKVYALIFAGGVGRRMSDSEIPKQFIEVDGKPIIIRTLEHFSKHEGVDGIVVVCLESWIDELKKEIKSFGIGKVDCIIPGGDTGFKSIRRGLDKIGESADLEDIVLICDGVRPVLNEKLITDCIEFAGEYESAVPVTPSIDSILYSEDGEGSTKNLDRKNIYLTQAPQGFKFGVIYEAHKEAEKRGMEAISSADLMIELGKKVHLYRGLRENIKVTTREDLESLRATYYYEHFKNFAQELFINKF